MRRHTTSVTIINHRVATSVNASMVRWLVTSSELQHYAVDDDAAEGLP